MSCNNSEYYYYTMNIYPFINTKYNIKTNIENTITQPSILDYNIKTDMENMIKQSGNDMTTNNEGYNKEVKPIQQSIHPFEKITEKMFDTYLKKNADYGNSFDESLDEWGLNVAAIRMGDKLNRFKKFVKNGTFCVRDEAVEDTLLDLATYSIMTLMYLQKK